MGTVIQKPLRSDDLSKLVDPWFNDYINGLDECALFEVILAANYLDIKPLLELTCAKVATITHKMSMQELRDFFGIENDFTPEEEAKVK